MMRWQVFLPDNHQFGVADRLPAVVWPSAGCQDINATSTLQSSSIDVKSRKHTSKVRDLDFKLEENATCKCALVAPAGP